MDLFDFEELVADMLGITDEQREDDDFIIDKFHEKFAIDFDSGYELAKALLMHTVPVKSALGSKSYHAFVSRTEPVMLMKADAE